jgi:membrane-bound lytic murein transglycosylase A
MDGQTSSQKVLHSPGTQFVSLNDGALNGRGLEIAYAKSPRDVFRLQVEGSGVLAFKQPDGSVKTMNIHTDKHNGHPYSSLGKAMRCLGVPEEYLQDDLTVGRYFKEHPERLMEMLNTSRGYSFFNTVKKGPVGAAGLELTPRHSVAVDKALIPFGSVGLLSVDRPSDNSGPDQAFSTLVIPQDVGSAIKINHVDIFWGWDSYAEKAATTMKNSGVYFIGVPKRKP